jgi:hypothetical protein
LLAPPSHWPPSPERLKVIQAILLAPQWKGFSKGVQRVENFMLPSGATLH